MFTSAFRHEAAALLRVAAPLIVGQISNVAMVFVDTLFAGRLSAVDLAAVGVGGTLWSSANLMVLGTLLAVPAFVSSFDGGGRHSHVGAFFRQAAWVALAMAALVFLVARNVAGLLALIGVDPSIIPAAIGYMDAIAWGAPFYAWFYLLRFVSDGIGRTAPAMYLGLVGFVANIPLDYVLMYGKLGFPAMGAAGCGYATAIVLGIQALVITIYVARSRHYQNLRLFARLDRPHLGRCLEILKVGLPSGMAIFVESSMFMVATLLMGTIGTIAVAGHQIALNFSAFVFMIPLGLAMAITVRVGNAAGRNDLAEARFRGLSGLKVVLITQLISATVIVIGRSQIVGIYTTDGEVATIALGLLLFAAIFQLSDGIQVAAAAALRGLKDTRVPLAMMVLSYWVLGIPLSYLLGIRYGQAGAGIWIGLIAGLTVAAVLLTARFGRKSRLA